MFLEILLSSSFIFVISGQNDIKKCCFVSTNHSGITMNTNMKSDFLRGFHDRVYRPVTSNSSCSRPLKTFNNDTANYDPWFVMKSNGDSKINQVLDQRWENFPTRINKNVKSGYISLKPLTNNLLENLGCREKQWCHHLFRQDLAINGTRTYYIVKDANEIKVEKEEILGRNVLIKYHEHTYIWTNVTTNDTIIYEDKNFPKTFSKSCISLYLAMCKECNLTLTERGTNVEKNIKGNDGWTREHICSNFSVHLTIQVSTHSQDKKKFWAIGDIVFFNCTGTNESEILGQRFLELYPGVEGCEDANNEKIEAKKCTENEEENVTTSPEIRVENETQSQKNSEEIDNEEKNESQAGIDLLYLLLIIPAIAIPLAVFGFFKYKKRLVGDTYLVPNTVSDQELEQLNPVLRKDQMITKINIQNFENYVRAAFDPQNTGVDLDKQFSTLPTGYLRSYVVGRQPENSANNRHPKIIPYDDTRVILGRNLGDSSNLSEYINASYVEGAHAENEYIVTQNPIKVQQVSTIVDIWRMIWQENIQFVVMITDRQKKDFVEYWPSLNRTIQYGGISVRFEEMQEHAHYIRRLLTISRFGITRKIKQYHYVSWVDTDQIMYSHTLVPFMNKLLEIPHKDHPILVHCDEGTGRSGVVILCDIALRLAPAKGHIDLYQIVKKLRNCRFQLVQNVHQYKLAHLVVLECLQYKETTLKVGQDFPNEVIRLLENQATLTQQWDYLEQLMWYDEALSPHTYVKQYPNKNRYENVLPETHSRVILKYIAPDYINAFYVNSYRETNKFIVTQQPMPQTLTDFWIMVLQHNVATIVNLNEIDINQETYCLFWPTTNKPILKPCADITVEYKEKSDHVHYEKLTIEVQEEARHRLTITVFNMKDWHSEMIVPNSTDELLQLYDDLMYPKLSNFTVIITCDNGITASGLFVCLAYLLGKMNQEKQCDLIESVRTMRHSHRQFINIDQFQFLYKCAMTYYNKQL